MNHKYERSIEVARFFMEIADARIGIGAVFWRQPSVVLIGLAGSEWPHVDDGDGSSLPLEVADATCGGDDGAGGLAPGS